MSSDSSEDQFLDRCLYENYAFVCPALFKVLSSQVVRNAPFQIAGLSETTSKPGKTQISLCVDMPAACLPVLSGIFTF